MSFARTKIQAPRQRPGSVARPALEARLDRALREHRLVLLCAPAGFGKTGLLTRVLSTLTPDRGVAWVACDEDDDLHRVVLACAPRSSPSTCPGAWSPTRWWPRRPPSARPCAAPPTTCSTRWPATRGAG